MGPRFAKSVPAICMFTNKLQDYVCDTHKVRIIMCNHAILSPQLLQNYPAALQKKGAALGNCFGFVDGTVRPISRSERNQRILYNGHKRVHAIKFQYVVLPNAWSRANMYGPVVSSISIMLHYQYICNFDYIN